MAASGVCCLECSHFEARAAKRSPGGRGGNIDRASGRSFEIAKSSRSAASGENSACLESDVINVVQWSRWKSAN
eukprot:scaffold109416_cov33-Tisochrysis_lutea.AAC.10